jgi:cytoplasmic iron level regulating protein YaaA (DUF328/UPF0246 family)
VLVNLASQEYFRAVDERALGLTIITPVFKDWSRGEYRVLSFFAKRARGMMVRYILERRCRKPAELLDFDSAGLRSTTKRARHRKRRCSCAAPRTARERDGRCGDSLSAAAHGAPAR